jgi:hypothetical protein
MSRYASGHAPRCTNAEETHGVCARAPSSNARAQPVSWKACEHSGRAGASVCARARARVRSGPADAEVRLADARARRPAIKYNISYYITSHHIYNSGPADAEVRLADAEDDAEEEVDAAGAPLAPLAGGGGRGHDDASQP